MNLHFASAARAELREACEWYEQQKEGLGRDFGREIARCVTQIVEHPTLWAERELGFRCARVKRFPYRVYDRIEGDDVYVLAVAHGSRRPGYWHDRL